MTWDPRPPAGPTRRSWREGARVLLMAMLVLGGTAVRSQVPSGALVPAAGAVEPQVRFDILEFRIEGNTVLSVPVIEQVVTPFLGPGRTMADVEAARAALEKAYQGTGWLTVFVDVPEQR